MGDLVVDVVRREGLRDALGRVEAVAFVVLR